MAGTIDQDCSRGSSPIDRCTGTSDWQNIDGTDSFLVRLAHTNWLKTTFTTDVCQVC